MEQLWNNKIDPRRNLALLRSRDTHKNYSNSPKQKACPFCEVKPTDERVLEADKNVKLIRNIYPYEWWDRCKVVDHLLITPNKHTDKLADLSEATIVEYMKIASKYEKQGYSLYARAPGNKRKTQLHQHMHLIKTDNKPRGIAFFLKKPYITWYR